MHGRMLAIVVLTIQTTKILMHVNMAMTMTTTIVKQKMMKIMLASGNVHDRLLL